MDKSKAATILATYSPPLSPAQIDEICEKISRLSELEKTEATTEVAKLVPAPKKKKKSKSRRVTGEPRMNSVDPLIKILE